MTFENIIKTNKDFLHGILRCTFAIKIIINIIMYKPKKIFRKDGSFIENIIKNKIYNYLQKFTEQGDRILIIMCDLEKINQIKCNIPEANVTKEDVLTYVSNT